MAVVDDKVSNHVNVGLLNDHLVGVLWNYRREEVEEYDKVVASLTGIEFHTKNLVKLQNFTRQTIHPRTSKNHTKSFATLC